VSARHKRPFAVFAAVALICGIVLITGVRSKAEPPGPVAGSLRVSTSGTLSPLPEPQGPVTSEAAPPADPDLGDGSPADPDPSAGFEAPPSADSGSDDGSDDVSEETDPLDGVISVPPLVVPDPDDAVPGDDESGPQDSRSTTRTSRGLVGQSVLRRGKLRGHGDLR
jgi:hypothetical protein